MLVTLRHIEVAVGQLQAPATSFTVGLVDPAGEARDARFIVQAVHALPVEPPVALGRGLLEVLHQQIVMTRAEFPGDLSQRVARTVIA
jgi:hypothetical protein